jgi:hypothetical protein
MLVLCHPGFVGQVGDLHVLAIGILHGFSISICGINFRSWCRGLAYEEPFKSHTANGGKDLRPPYWGIELRKLVTDGMAGVIPRSEKEGTKPPYVCPGCSNHTYSNNMITKFHVQ